MGAAAASAAETEEPRKFGREEKLGRCATLQIIVGGGGSGGGGCWW